MNTRASRGEEVRALNMVQAHSTDFTGSSGSTIDFRARLLGAMNASLAERGYSNTTVADVVRRARTSRRTFYQYFPDRETCFVALLTDNNAGMIRAITAAVDPEAPWEEQVRHAVHAWIAAAQSRPAIMLAWIRDAPALGEAAQRLQQEFLDAFIDMVQTLSGTDQVRAAGVGPVSRARAIMLLGGLHELTAVTFQQGGDLDAITDEAVSASIALLAPSPS